MITKTYKTREEWLEDRMGRITGSKLGDIYAKRGGKKIGYYQLIADKMAIKGSGDMSAMDRGNFLEEEALLRFEKESGKAITQGKVMWFREDNEFIAYSPDGIISETEVVEVKCLASARHIEALLTQQVPKDYREQIAQAFVVNDKLETLYMVFFDNRMIAHDFFYLTVKRADMQEEVDIYLPFEHATLKEIDGIVKSLIEF